VGEKNAPKSIWAWGRGKKKRSERGNDSPKYIRGRRALEKRRQHVAGIGRLPNPSRKVRKRRFKNKEKKITLFFRVKIWEERERKANCWRRGSALMSPGAQKRKGHISLRGRFISGKERNQGGWTICREFGSCIGRRGLQKKKGGEGGGGEK